MEIKTPYLLFLGDAPDQPAAKTALGVVDWRPEWCVGQLRLPGCKADAGVPDLTIGEAVAKGAKTLVIGVVNSGGVLPHSWVETIVTALEAGLDVASGLHRRLQSIPEVNAAAEKHGRALHNLRTPAEEFTTGKGAHRTGKRVLTVGTDCNVGKKYTALALEREMRERGLKADFRATGQTGVLISRRGTSVDAVIADFISGAAEWLSPSNDDDHWDLVEGQGSIWHPSFAGVTLGLLHGAQPDAVVLCHEPTRTKMRGTDYPLPSIRSTIDTILHLGRLTNPAIQCVGIAVNTSQLPEGEVARYLKGLEREHGLPATDPIRHGVGPIVDRLLACVP
ncbi:N-acetyltransferase DgcN [Futiania mangrovi]|uniref:DUF1611 domain-containing protein n=1 Tax=Futiania mangrovi TaxID=2959716 RepID=A0A9J6P7R7_9PROT|nr:N-acetyltransferase DgcN [Futiania mangrovii]MCP1335012.1 DUF1611 domain-containing protein [Futiania mangrovii]